MVRLIACDIDGTLLRGDETEIAPAVFDEIARLRRRGIRFCPASGRQYTSLRRLFAPVCDDICYLCENGAILYGAGAPGPVLFETIMPRARAVALCRDIMAAPGCEVLISGADMSYLCPVHTDLSRLMREEVGNRVTVLRAPEDVPEDILKVSAYCEAGAAPLTATLGARWQGEFAAALGGECWLDLQLADKGTGLRGLCAALGVAPADVLAIGDNYNDLPMLALAGTPYLMATAAPALRRRFANQCTRVEDVLAAL